MYRDRRSLLLLALIAALPLFLFVSFYLAFEAQNRQRAIERNALADAQLVAARVDGVLREALGASESLASTGAIADADIGLAITRAAQFRRNNPDLVQVALDDNFKRVRLFSLGRASPTDPFLEPGKVALSLRRESDCRCILISRGLTAADGTTRTLHVALSNASIFTLMPRAYGDYEVSAVVDERGHFVARSIADGERFELRPLSMCAVRSIAPRTLAFIVGRRSRGPAITPPSPAPASAAGARISR